MSRTRLASAALLSFLFIASLNAQEKGDWRPANETAKKITGEIFFTESKITINFASFTIAQIRAIEPAEALALFNADPGGQGNLYRLDISADKRFLHKNTLCGSEPAEWAITYVTGRTMQLAFFTEPSIPKLTVDDLNGSTRLCGIFTYNR
jgi:hypothetical protein